MFLPIISAGAAASMMASRAATTTTATVPLGRRQAAPTTTLSGRVSPDELEMRMLLRSAPQSPRQEAKAVAEPRTFDSSAWTGRAA